jgi:hypothetical protein
MTYEQALSIATRNFSDLLVDPPNADLPLMFVVRKTKAGHPFSIHLPQSINPEHTPDEALAQETEHFLASLAAARKHLV